MQVGDTATLISGLLQSIRIKKSHFIENRKQSIWFPEVCLFDKRSAKKNIDVLMSKNLKPHGTRLVNTLSRTPAYLLLTYFQYLRLYPNFVDPHITAFLSKMESPISRPPKRGCDLS